MTLSNIAFRFQVGADATSTAVAGTTAAASNGSKIRIGHSSIQRIDYTSTNVDVVYGFTLTSTAAADVVTLTGSTGALAKTTGTPSIARWTGETGDTTAEDFEGIALPGQSGDCGIYLETPSTNSKYIAVANSAAHAPDVPEMQPGCIVPFFLRSAAASIGTITFTWENDAAGVGDVIHGIMFSKASA